MFAIEKGRAVAEESMDDYERSLRRRRRRTTLVMVGVGVAALLGLVGFALQGVVRDALRPRYVIGPEQAATIRGLIATARPLSERTEQVYREAVTTAAREGWVARPDLGACENYLAQTSLGTYQSVRRPLVETSDSELAGVRSRLDVSRANAIARLERDLEEDSVDPDYGASAVRSAEALNARPRSVEVLFVEEHRSAPRVDRNSGVLFEPGVVRGRAYLYDHGEGRVRCAARIEAMSSEVVEQSALAGDLTVQLWNTIVRSLQFAAGPPAAQLPVGQPAP